MKLICALTLALIAGMANAQKEKGDSLFVLQYQPGANWNFEVDAWKQKYFEVHSKLMSSLRKDGVVRLGGRYSDKGMMIVQIGSQIELWNLLAADSTLKYGVFRAEVFPFDVFYNGCIK